MVMANWKASSARRRRWPCGGWLGGTTMRSVGRASHIHRRSRAASWWSPPVVLRSDSVAGPSRKVDRTACPGLARGPEPRWRSLRVCTFNVGQRRTRRPILVPAPCHTGTAGSAGAADHCGYGRPVGMSDRVRSSLRNDRNKSVAGLRSELRKAHKSGVVGASSMARKSTSAVLVFVADSGTTAAPALWRHMPWRIRHREPRWRLWGRNLLASTCGRPRRRTRAALGERR